jgi:hypothetical protein
MVSTKRALHYAANRDRENGGLLQGRTYTRSTMDRLLDKYGQNKKNLIRPKAKRSIKAIFSNQVWYVDATVLPHYYLNIKDNKTIVEIKAPKNDQHLDDLLVRYEAKKIWVYYLVEKYSRAYLLMAFAPTPIGTNSKHGGENTLDLLTFLQFCFLPKKNLTELRGLKHPFESCPIEGAPHNLYSDKGSALMSYASSNFLYNLGIEPIQHVPGHPWAKGPVESRIGSDKRGSHPLIIKNTIHTLDDLNYHLMSWAHYDNTVKKKYEKYLEGCTNNPIRKITLQNINDASINESTGTVDGFGYVKFRGLTFFVNENIVGEKIRIHWRPSVPGSKELLSDDVLIAIDRYGRKFNMEPPTEVNWGEFKSFPKSDAEKISDEVRILAQNLRKTARFEDSLPPVLDTNLIHLPPKSEPVQTHSMIVPDKFENIKLATDWVTIEIENSGIIKTDAELANSISTEFKKVHDVLGYIPGDFAEKILRTIQNNTLKRFG